MGTYDTGWYNRYSGSSSACRAVSQYSSSSTTTTVTVSAHTETWWRYWNSWSDGDDSYGEAAITYPLNTNMAYAIKQVRPNNSNGSGANGGNTSTVSYAFARGTSAYDVYVRCRCYNKGMPSDTGWHTAATINVPALPTPAAPTNCAHTRNSDAQNTVSWTRNATTNNPYSAIRVERCVNAGTWTQITSAAGTATSFADSTCSTNATYQYRVRAEYNGMFSGYTAATTLTYNTPAVPGKPSVSRQPDNSVAISFTNTGTTQKLTSLQRSTNGSSWSDIKSVSGTSVTTMTDVPGGGTFYYRVRNERDSLLSAWSSSSDAVVTLIPPAAPTLLGPPDNVFFLVGEQPVLSWKHNPQDGSAQISAEVRYSTDGGSTWAVVSVPGSVGSHTLAALIAINSSVYWQVRTKGSHNDFGAWSASNYYRVIEAPNVIITSPDATVIDLPLVVSWSYSDLSGTQNGATATIKRDGLVIYTKQVSGSASTFTVSTAELLPDNATEHELTVSVTSTSGASTSAVSSFSTAYAEPAIPICAVMPDKANASVALAIHAGNDSSLPETVFLDICRKSSDGRTVVLLLGATSGSTAIDPYPPLDQEITYIFTAHSAAGAVSRLEETIFMPSNGHALFNFGLHYERIVRIALDMAHDEGIEHEKEVFPTAACILPTASYGQAKAQTGSVSGRTLRDAYASGYMTKGVDVADIDELMAWNRRAVMRLPFKEVMAVDATVRKSIGVNQSTADVSVAWERVRDDGLVIVS